MKEVIWGRKIKFKVNISLRISDKKNDEHGQLPRFLFVNMIKCEECVLFSTVTAHAIKEEEEAENEGEGDK